MFHRSFRFKGGLFSSHMELYLIWKNSHSLWWCSGNSPSGVILSMTDSDIAWQTFFFSLQSTNFVWHFRCCFIVFLAVSSRGRSSATMNKNKSHPNLSSSKIFCNLHRCILDNLRCFTACCSKLLRAFLSLSIEVWLDLVCLYRVLFIWSTLQFSSYSQTLTHQEQHKASKPLDWPLGAIYGFKAGDLTGQSSRGFGAQDILQSLVSMVFCLLFVYVSHCLKEWMFTK